MGAPGLVALPWWPGPARLAPPAAAGVLAVGARIRRGRPAGQRQNPVPGQRHSRQPRGRRRSLDEAGAGGADPALRARVGPTVVFNPSELGDIGSDLHWDPTAGCTDQGVADRRAWALVRGGGGAAGVDRPDFWAGKAQEILRCYLLAAALVGAGMTRVMYWANDPDDPEPVAILDAHPHHVPAGWLPTLRTHLRASPNTRTGYFATVTSCVGFMDSPTVAEACRPGPGGQFDVAGFLRGAARCIWWAGLARSGWRRC